MRRRMHMSSIGLHTYVMKASRSDDDDDDADGGDDDDDGDDGWLQ